MFDFLLTADHWGKAKSLKTVQECFTKWDSKGLNLRAQLQINKISINFNKFRAVP